MPLRKRAGLVNVKYNIREMIKAGHPRDQAVAAAMRIQDEAEKRKKARK